MADYTQRLNDALYSSWDLGDNSNDNYSEVLGFLNSPSFRTFGEGLIALIKSKIPENSTEDPVDFFKRCCKEKNITVASRNTLTNWFSNGLRPKKSSDSRRCMFAIAFALELSIAETSTLFHTVYLDRAFNKRNYEELIYYYCLQHGLSLQHAENLICRVSFVDTDFQDLTVFTSVISAETEHLGTDEEILAYIKSHAHNYALSSKTAKNALEKYISKASNYAKDEAQRTWLSELLRGKSLASLNFMYEVIVGQSITGKRGTKTIFKNAELPKEIKSCFPQPSVFAEKSPSFEELRKMIVLLFSYCFWCDVQKNDVTNYFDDYIAQLNHLLNECGFSTLYCGNPFDWMFLYCTYMEMPLDTFRGVLEEALKE